MEATQQVYPVSAFKEEELLKYGNELEISGMVLANGEKGEIILFPNSNVVPLRLVKPTEKQWEMLLHQLDTLGVEGLDKTVLRKSQRQIEQNIIWNVYRRDNYTCQYCNNGEIALTMDHIVLWEKMGDNVEDNLISACRKCNKTRGNTEFIPWLESKYLLGRLKEGWNIRWADQMTLLLEAYQKASKVPLRPTQRSR